MRTSVRRKSAGARSLDDNPSPLATGHQTFLSKAVPPMRTATTSALTPGMIGRRTGHVVLIALLLAGLISFAAAAMSPTTAQAAPLTIDQCNGRLAGPGGATTVMNCTVTVVNTINGGTTSSTTTVTRECALDACVPGDTPAVKATITSSSTNLVTNVTQCNGSGNDAAHPINCDVTITNNISADTPGARPVTAATVNQCVGSATGGGGTGVVCDPVPASTTNATVTQCNGSATGGGSGVACTVATASRVSPAIPIRVNQCNGSGNAGGTIVTCRTFLTTNITARASATPTASPRATATATPSPSQVSRVPGGSVQAGGGSTSGSGDGRLLALGASLLLAAAIGVGYRRRLVHGAARIHR
jgi:hypothetical protein